MNILSFIIGLVGFSLISCNHTNNITVAFSEVPDIYKGSPLIHNGQQIGKVIDFKPTKTLDSIYLILTIDKKHKIPKRSTFFIKKNLIADNIINVEFSSSDTYLSSKDISVGIIRPLDVKTGSQLDSVRQKMKKITKPRVDTARQ